MSDQRPPNTVHAFCSLILPGLGQFLQERPSAAMGFFLIFCLIGTLSFFYINIAFLMIEQSRLESSWVYLIAYFGCGVHGLLLVLASFYTVLDAAVWQAGNKTRFKKPITVLAAAYFFFIVPILCVPGYFTIREAWTCILCREHMRDIYLSLSSYNNIYGHFPPIYTVGENGRPLHSWRVLILPYLGEDNIGDDWYKQIRLNEPWDSEHNKQFHSKMPHIYQCPSNPKKGCCYSFVYGDGAAFVETQPIPDNS